MHFLRKKARATEQTEQLIERKKFGQERSTLDVMAKKARATQSQVHEYDFLGWFANDIDAVTAKELPVNENWQMDYDLLDIFINYMCTDPKKRNMIITASVI